MRTLLYKDNDKILTFAEVRENYMTANNSELPIPDDEMLLISFLMLKQNGGNLILIQDKILSWCNDYSEYNEADRYLSQTERDSSVKDIYESILANDSYIKEIKANIDNDSTGTELLERLNEILKNNAKEQMKHYFFTDINGISNSYSSFYVLGGTADELIEALNAEDVDKDDVFGGAEDDNCAECSIMSLSASFAGELSKHIKDKLVIGFCGWDIKEMFIYINGLSALQNTNYKVVKFDTQLENEDENWYSFRITIEDMNRNTIEIDSGGDCEAKAVTSFFELMMY